MSVKQEFQGLHKNHFNKFNKIRTLKNKKKNIIKIIPKCDIYTFKLMDKYENIKLLLSNLNSDVECLDILYGEDLVDYFNDNNMIKENIQNTEFKINKFILLLKKEKELFTQITNLNQSYLKLQQNIACHIYFTITKLLNKMDNIKNSYNKINHKKQHFNSL
jgi:uncharacterized coiled-coil DUF342 family protein